MSACHPRLQLALEIVDATGEMIRAAFDARQHVTTEKAANDLATETDSAVEIFIATKIAAAFPGDVLLGEEGGERALSDSAASGIRWIVDPLDGTFNFVHGFPYIATSIAIERNGVIEAGVIANPVNHEIFYAERGTGAWLRQASPAGADDAILQRLQVSSTGQLDRALVASVLPSAASTSFDRVLPAWLAVTRAVGSIRRTGAAALDLAHVAAGRLDGFFVMSLASWDAAAGALLVQEAGGAVCDFSGGDEFLETNQVVAGDVNTANALAEVLAPWATQTKSSKTKNQ